MGIIIEGDAYHSVGQELKIISKNIHKTIKKPILTELTHGQDICFLTETTKESNLSALTEFNSYATNEDSLATILVRRKSSNFKVVDFNVLNHFKNDYSDRVSTVVLGINSTKILLVCVYGPVSNSRKSTFYKTVLQAITDYVDVNPDIHVLLAGDLNLVVDPCLDSAVLNKQRSHEMTATKPIMRYRHKLKIIDCFRNLDQRIISFTCHTVFNCRRIDQILIPIFLHKRVKEFKVFYDGLGNHERLQIRVDISPLLKQEETFEETIQNNYQNRVIRFGVEGKLKGDSCYCSRNNLDKSAFQLKELIFHHLTDRPKSFKKNLEFKIKEDKLTEGYLDVLEEAITETTIGNSEDSDLVVTKRKRPMGHSNDDTRQLKKQRVDEYKGSVYYRTGQVFKKLSVIPNPYICTYKNCSREFSSSKSFRYHVDGHTADRNYECKYKSCNAKFKRLSDRNIHMKNVHRTEDLFECCYPFCAKKFKVKNQRRFHHLLVHQNYRPLICLECKFKCAFPCQLLNHHNEIHKNIRKKKCNQCGARFKRDEHLLNHLKRVHYKIQSYACDECPKSFTTAQSLQRHKDVHKQVFKHKCPQCQYKSHQHQNLLNHIKAVHIGTYDIPCKEITCNRMFKTKSDAKKHHDQVHLDICPHPCNRCGKRFKRTAHLKEHLTRCG